MDGRAKWRDERHIIYTMSTDASLSGFGVVGPGGELIMRDYWRASDSRPIHLKEAEAVLQGLLTVSADIEDHQVVIYVDNTSVMSA